MNTSNNKTSSSSMLLSSPSLLPKPKSQSRSRTGSRLSLIVCIKISGFFICILSLMNISYQMGITVGEEKFNYATTNSAAAADAAAADAVDGQIDSPRQQQNQKNQNQIQSLRQTQKKEEEEGIKHVVHVHVPKYIVPDIYKKEQDRIDYKITDDQRCKFFDVKPLSSVKDKPYYEYAMKRKIFLGTMLADETNDVILAHSTEVYGLYDGIAFVESNTTHFNTPRSLNYGPNTDAAFKLIKSDLFGSSNKTHVDINYYYADKTKMNIIDHPHLNNMNREVEQRNLILGMWIKQGMERYDVGIMSDLDEIVSRDFLNALTVCDFPKLRYNPDAEERPTCQTPKIILSTISFEGSPKCIKVKPWFHPDIILGNCILGIGDNSGRVTPKRQYHNEYGQRTEEYGHYDYKKYPKDIVENNRYPLWDGRDIRTVSGNEFGLTTYVDDIGSIGDVTGTSVYGTAYHLHNWFNDLDVLRNKYATYGHSSSKAMEYPLSKINKDLDLLVRCNRNLGNDGTIYNHTKYPIGHVPNNNTNSFEYYNYTTNTNGIDIIRNPKFVIRKNSKESVVEVEEKVWIQFGGNRPIYFMNQSYVKKRNALVQQLLKIDENKYDSIYD
jgi:hypothetical protein